MWQKKRAFLEKFRVSPKILWEIISPYPQEYPTLGYTQLNIQPDFSDRLKDINGQTQTHMLYNMVVLIRQL